MHNNGVNKSREHEGVGNVGLELAPLSNSSSNDGGGGGSEGKLEEKSDQLISSMHIDKEKVLVPNEGFEAAIGSSVRKGITDTPESNSTSTGIQDVLEHDILDVLSTDGSGAKHGKTSLHEEYHCSGEEEVEHIETCIGVGDGRIKVGDAYAEFFYGGHVDSCVDKMNYW